MNAHTSDVDNFVHNIMADISGVCDLCQRIIWQIYI